MSHSKHVPSAPPKRRPVEIMAGPPVLGTWSSLVVGPLGAPGPLLQWVDEHLKGSWTSAELSRKEAARRVRHIAADGLYLAFAFELKADADLFRLYVGEAHGEA
jgi:hypothetical protein